MSKLNLTLNNQSGFAPLMIVLIVTIALLASYIIVKEVSPRFAGNQETNTTAESTPSPSAEASETASPTPSATAKATARPVVKTPTPVPTPSCITVETSGMFENNTGFESKKCYTQADANALDSAIDKYNKAVFNYNGAASRADVTCQGFTESFKQQCEQSKQDADKYKAEMDQYSGEIRAIQARGT